MVTVKKVGKFKWMKMEPQAKLIGEPIGTSKNKETSSLAKVAKANNN